ncbi:hypothetical protein TAC_0061 [Acinetobacter phage TAC1]|nr:hypothetical protein TAC_0061 [Acinetobacter phage TAC1]
MDILMQGGATALVGGKLLLTASRGASLAQRLVIRLNTFLGSWFLNENLGIDYFNKVFEKTITKSSIDATFQTAIYADNRVETITHFSSHVKANIYHMEFKVKARDGVVSDMVDVTVTNNGITINVGA